LGYLSSMTFCLLDVNIVTQTKTFETIEVILMSFQFV
jgi:hypothetical protein